MDNRTNQMLEASFRGVAFRVRSESLTDGGRKIVLHEYINSSERFVEDLGQIPDRFSITAFVHGEDFIGDAKLLQSALNQEGVGTLFMPNFGSVEVYALPYTKDASQQSIGEIKFNLSFAVGRPAAAPDLSPVDAQQVYSKADNARQVIQDILAGKLNIPDVAANASVMEFDVNASIDNTLDKFKDILPTENLEKIQSKIKRMKSIMAQLIRDPASLASDMIGGVPTDAGIWQELSLGLTGGNGIVELLQAVLFGDSALNLSDINGDSGDDIPVWDATTAQRIARNNNRLNIINSQRISALVGAYESAAAADYQTQSEVIDIREALESAHDDLMLNDTIDSDIVQSDDDVRSAVESVRLASLAVISQKEQETYVLSSLKVRAPSSVFVQTYNLYAEEFITEDQAETKSLSLRGLNPELPAIAMDGEISIFRTV